MWKLCGVEVSPVLSFDERGHQKNYMTYYVCGVGKNGEAPKDFYPVIEDFVGEGGNFERPYAVVCNMEGEKAGKCFDGLEAVGGIRFEEVTLEAGESISYTILIGVTDDKEEIDTLVQHFSTEEKVREELEKVKNYW